MRITGYRTLTTVHDWGRPVGDANGVFPDGLVTVPLVLVDTDEGITGVGLGPHLGLEQRLRRHRGRGPAGHRRAVRPDAPPGVQGRSRREPSSGPSAPSTRPCGTSRRRRPVSRCGGCSGAWTGRSRRTPRGWTSRLSDDAARDASTGPTPSAGLRAAKLKGGLDVDQDLARLTLVRDVLADANPGSRPGLMLDANESWTRKQAVRHVAELERTVDLIWVEEPVRRWDAAGHGRRRARGSGVDRRRREPHRARAVPAAAGRRRPRRRPDRGRLGGHPLPAGGRPGPRPRPAGQPDRHHARRPGARRDRGAQPHGHRAPGPHAADRTVARPDASRTVGSSSATAPVWG